MPVGYTPIFRINQEGVDITSRFNDRLTQIKTTLTGGRGVQDTCEITLDDRDWKIASPTVGRKLEIYLGYKEVGLAQQNVFEIKTVEYLGPPRSIKITGTSTSFIGSLKAPTIKEFDGKTIKDVLNDIGKKAGVEVMVEQGLGEIKIPYLNQTQSSLHLLQELERRYGAVAKFDSGKLIFIPQDGRETASGATIPTLLLRPEHLARWSVRHDRRGDYSAARAAYIDPQTNEPTWIEEQNPRALTDDDGKAERYPFRLPQMFKNESEARASAKSTISTLNRSLGEINVTLAKGDPWVRAPQPVMLQQMREGINGIYVSETVTHTYLKSEGILTTITGKPPGSSEDIPAGAGSDVEVVGPQAGQKLGAKYVAPVFSDT